MISEHETIHEALDNLLFVYSVNKPDCPAVQRVIDAKWRAGFDVRNLPRDDALAALAQGYGGTTSTKDGETSVTMSIDALRLIVMDMRVKQPTADMTDLDLVKTAMFVSAYLNTLDNHRMDRWADTQHDNARDELSKFCNYVRDNRRILTTREKERAQNQS